MNEALQALAAQIQRYEPYNDQERADKALILRCLREQTGLLGRENPLAHLSASAWVVNADRTRALMAYHKVYNAWSWLGGHAEAGETDLLAVALREAREESGLRNVRPVTEDIFSLESLTVDGHVKRGQYVSSHLHLNVTYLLEADDDAPLTGKPDENAGAAWFGLDEAVAASTESWFREHIYAKLNRKLRELGR